MKALAADGIHTHLGHITDVMILPSKNANVAHLGFERIKLFGKKPLIRKAITKRRWRKQRVEFWNVASECHALLRLLAGLAKDDTNFTSLPS